VPALDDLNPPQRQAVTTLDGPLLVLAGAGSGKTRVITYRVAYLLEHGVAPDQVLAVSFTNKAADEMRERVRKLVGQKPAARLTLCTFHALGLQILKAEKAALGFRTGFTVYDAADQLGVVRECLRAVRLDDRRFDAKAILFRISRAKNAFLSPADLAASHKSRSKARDDYDLVTEEIYPRYQQALRGFHALDFDDLIVETVRLLDGDEGARGRWQKRFRYVMVDEYQDTNRSQLLLVRHLVALHNNLCVVGDDDQSIYAWRGAESGNILEFERHFPGARRITLDQNYRSTQVILGAANAVIANNARRHEKRLHTTQPGGDKLQLVVAENPEAEARFVAEEIDLLRARRGYRAGDCAVLYRSNVQARPFEEALRQQRIDYRMVGGQAFYERKEVKDAIAYLKAVLQPRDEISLRRIINYPARGIGDTSLERCAAHAAMHKTTLWEGLRAAADVEDLAPRAREAIGGFVALLERHRPGLSGEEGGGPGRLAEAARALVEETGLRDDIRAAGPTALAAQRRIENVEGFLRALESWEQRTREGAPGRRPSLGDYLHRLTLASTEDDAGEAADATRTTLCTLHGAKGLEFKVVFLVGLEEDLLPHRRTLNPIATDLAAEAADEADLSEERRLLYVGITRARELLYLSRCRLRGAGRGERSDRAEKPKSASRFLDEIPATLSEPRDLGAPAGDPADEEAFARECLAKLRQLGGD
jgi:DNA helicase-2/ATP-dependent DNA helicase PcrA